MALPSPDTVSWLVQLKQNLFRLQSDGHAPFVLGQRRVFILPTRSGLVFGVLLTVMLTGAINYNLALGHALVFLLAGLGLTGMIHTFRNLHGLRVSPGRADPVFSGEIAHFPLFIANERPTPRLALKLEAKPGHLVETAVNPQETRKISIPIPAEQRGWLQLPKVRLSSHYPVGLFVAWSYLMPEMRCIVYPKPINSALPAVSAREGGTQPSGDGGLEDFAGFREHQPADSLRHVAWKIEARQPGNAPLLIKQFSGGAYAELDLHWSLTDTQLPVETRISILTGWVIAAERKGLHFALSLPGIHLAAGQGEKHFRDCLEALALYQA